MNAARIERLWDRLDVATQDWLKANPGCVVLPRTVTTAINRATGGLPAEDGHGQVHLSPDDWAFIRAVARSSPVGQPQSSPGPVGPKS